MIFTIRIEHIVFIVFGCVFVCFVGCACISKCLKDKKIYITNNI